MIYVLISGNKLMRVVNYTSFNIRIDQRRQL